MITIAHTATVPPEVSGFILHDDNVVIPPRSGIRLRVLPPAARFDIDDVPAAAEESEQPVPERGAEVDNNEVVIDGVKLDSNSPLKTLAAACESLGISRRGGKAKCLERLWDHFQTQELIAAHGAQHQLRGDLARPVHYQSVLVEPSEKRIANHNLVHQFFAAWCEVCIANKSQQEGHPARQGEPAGAHTCVSFISVLHQEQSMNQKFVVPLFMITIQVLKLVTKYCMHQKGHTQLDLELQHLHPSPLC